MEKVSVIIPSFNSVRYLPESVGSALAQQGVETEVMVVDDGSTDGTERLAATPELATVRYRRLDTNHGGPSLARNTGIRESSGPFIALLDADDRFLAGHLAHAVDFLQKCPQAGLVFCRVIRNRNGRFRLHPAPNEYPYFYTLPKKPVGTDSFLLDREAAFCCLFRENFILPSGVVLRRQVLERIGLFDESLTNGDDRDLFFRIARHFPLGYLARAGIVYREHGDSISTRGGKLAENRIRVVRKQLASGLPAPARRHGRRRLAQNLSIAAWHFRQNGKFDLALDSYLDSIRTWPTLQAGRGLMALLLRREP